MTNLLSLGIEAYKAKDYTTAIAYFDEGIATESEVPVLAELYSGRGWSHYKQQDYAQSIRDCTQSIALDPTDFAYWTRGNAYEDSGELQAALADFTTCIGVSPDVSNYSSRARVWAALEVFDQAIADYTTALELDPDYLNIWSLRAFAYQDLGMNAEALTDLLHLRELDPDYENLDSRIQFLESQLEDTIQAEQILDQAAEFMSQGVDAFHQEDYSAAISYFDQAIAINPEFAEAYAYRGWAYAQMEQYEPAWSDCTTSLNLQPNALAYWLQGKLWQDADKTEAAIESFTMAIQLDPSDSANYFSRAVADYRLGRFADTIADCTSALSVSKSQRSSNIHLTWRAQAYEALGQYTEALTDLRTIQSMDPEWEDIEEKIAVLQAQMGEDTPQNSGQQPATESSQTLDALLANLEQLTGLPHVKAEVKKLVNLVRVQQLRRDRGLATPPLSLHLVFTGNPGTGKTTVARLISQIYQTLGLLSKGHVIEVDRSGLVAGFVGQTALKVKDVVTEARGGILFIDEAYTLVANSGHGSDFGREAIDTLLKAMEDYRDDFVVIVAGYPEQMTTFLGANPGLQSRFNKYIAFEDYTVSELCEILHDLCQSSGYFLNTAATCYVQELVHDLIQQNAIAFGNARGIRNLFEQAIAAQASRVIELPHPDETDLCTLDATDFVNTPLVLAAV